MGKQLPKEMFDGKEHLHMSSTCQGAHNMHADKDGTHKAVAFADFGKAFHDGGLNATNVIKFAMLSTGESAKGAEDYHEVAMSGNARHPAVGNAMGDVQGHNFQIKHADKIDMQSVTKVTGKNGPEIC